VSDQAAKEVVKEHGKVRWFNTAKGFGWINRERGGDSIFVHFSNIDVAGFKTLDQDAAVEFEVIETPKGLAAVCVRPIRR